MKVQEIIMLQLEPAISGMLTEINKWLGGRDSNEDLVDEYVVKGILLDLFFFKGPCKHDPQLFQKKRPGAHRMLCDALNDAVYQLDLKCNLLDETPTSLLLQAHLGIQAVLALAEVDAHRLLQHERRRRLRATSIPRRLRRKKHGGVPGPHDACSWPRLLHDAAAGIVKECILDYDVDVCLDEPSADGRDIDGFGDVYGFI